MIFRGDLLAKVLSGEKTVTRRPVGGFVYRPNRHYAVQPKRGKVQVARIFVTRTRVEPLGAIDDEDAGREGFADRQAFFRYWEGLYGLAAGTVDPAQQVWRIAFYLLEPAVGDVFERQIGPPITAEVLTIEDDVAKVRLRRPSGRAFTGVRPVPVSMFVGGPWRLT